MKKKLIFILAAVLAACPLLFTGCHNPFEDEQYDKDKINLKVAILSSDSEYNTMLQLKKAYEKDNPLINIIISTLNSDFEQSVAQFVSRPADFPDVLWVPGEHHSPFSSAGNFINLKDRFEAELDMSDFYDEVMNVTHYSNTDDGIWFAPRDYNKPVVMYNKAMFRMAGITGDKMPGNDWNMTDFFNVCKTLKEKINNPNNTEEEKEAGLVKGTYAVDADLGWNPSYMSLIKHYGGKLIDTSLTGEASLTMDSKASKDAYKLIYQNFPYKEYCPSSDTSNLFTAKKSAMWINVRPEIQACINLGIDVDFLPMPTDYVAVGCSGYAIPKDTMNRLDTKEGNTKTNDQLAWEFIKFILSKDGQNVMGSTGTGVPVLKSLAESGTWLQYHDASLNHKAFTMHPERDMSQMDFYIYKPDKHLSIMKEFNALAITITSPLTYLGSELGAAGGTSWKNFEDAVALSKNKLTALVK